jgi:hypothetical protein
MGALGRDGRGNRRRGPRAVSTARRVLRVIAAGPELIGYVRDWQGMRIPPMLARSLD